jgi:hypothetical protein
VTLRVGYQVREAREAAGTIARYFDTAEVLFGGSKGGGVRGWISEGARGSLRPPKFMFVDASAAF